MSGIANRFLNRKTLGIFGILAAISLALGFLRDWRIGSKAWKLCAGPPGERGVAGDFPRFDLRLRGGFGDTLYVDGIPQVRLMKYRYYVLGEHIQVESFDHTKWSSYCSK